MTTKNRILLALPAAGATICLSQAASAAVVADYQFNTLMDPEGWSFVNISGQNADGDSLNGTATNNDPQLRHTTISESTTGNWESLIFRVRETQDEAPAGVVSTFNPTGIAVQFNQTGANGALITAASNFSAVDSGDGFFTVTVDISGFTQSSITHVRVDPIGGASSNSNSQTQGNTFEVDFIQITDDTPIPEPSSLALLGLGGLAMMRRRR